MASIGTRVHGLACWFDVLFNGRYLQIFNLYLTAVFKFSLFKISMKGHFSLYSSVQRWLTTAPGQPTTHWYQLRCVLSQPLYVVAGQEITGQLRMVAHNAQSYTLYLTLSSKFSFSVCILELIYLTLTLLLCNLNI